MRPASPAQIPAIVAKRDLGGESPTKPSLYEFVKWRTKLDEAQKHGFSSIVQYEKHRFKQTCDEFERMLKIGKYKEVK